MKKKLGGGLTGFEPRTLKTNFSWLATLSLGPKRFLHSKGPKNVICLWLRLGNIKQSQICNFPSLSQRQITFLGPLEWRNLFELKDKVSFLEKLVFRSGVRCLFLFVLTDAILLKLDLQKRALVLDNPPNGKLFVKQKCIIYVIKLEVCLSVCHAQMSQCLLVPHYWPDLKSKHTYGFLMTRRRK